MDAKQRKEYVQSLVNMGIKKEKLGEMIGCSRPTFRRKLDEGDFTDEEVATMKEKIKETTDRKVA